MKSISELAFRAIFPNPGDETSVTRQEFLAAAKLQYAYQYLLLYWKMRREEGYFTMPSHLLVQESFEVINNEVDISCIKTFRAIGDDAFLISVGGLTCSCTYVKTNVNRKLLLCDDNSLPDGERTFLVLGKKIIFPKGAHTSPIEIIYASTGDNLKDDTEVEESVGAMVYEKLLELYGRNKLGLEDVTNNSSSQN
ncbi:MAG: hypothetical protein ABIN25_07195 [Ginsengibacter sp.]